MRVQVNTTLKCNSVMIVAGEILDSDQQEFPDFITDLIDQKSAHVTVLADLPKIVVAQIEEDVIDDLIGAPDEEVKLKRRK